MLRTGTRSGRISSSASPFDFVITVCDDADRNCPNFPGKVGKRVYIGFPDPAKATGTDAEKLAVFRRVRDDIQKQMRAYFETAIRKER
jgi:arsenate reductase